ncbi:TSUP family transporter, partial [Streptomyces clavuligerus]|uniref:TSUP family transporter n=1 Tax=Streptomyces clavuligerus TaxID=1901 RepID=UPI001E64E573
AMCGARSAPGGGDAPVDVPRQGRDHRVPWPSGPVAVVALEMQAAVGTSLLVISANSLASLAARGGTAAGVDWAVIAPFAGAAILGAWDGRRLAAKASGALLRRVFAVLLLAVAAFMAADVLTGGLI